MMWKRRLHVAGVALIKRSGEDVLFIFLGKIALTQVDVSRLTFACVSPQQEYSMVLCRQLAGGKNHTVTR